MMLFLYKYYINYFTRIFLPFLEWYLGRGHQTKRREEPLTEINAIVKSGLVCKNQIQVSIHLDYMNFPFQSVTNISVFWSLLFRLWNLSWECRWEGAGRMKEKDDWGVHLILAFKHPAQCLYVSWVCRLTYIRKLAYSTPVGVTKKFLK